MTAPIRVLPAAVALLLASACGWVAYGVTHAASDTQHRASVLAAAASVMPLPTDAGVALVEVPAAPGGTPRLLAGAREVLDTAPADLLPIAAAAPAGTRQNEDGWTAMTLSAPAARAPSARAAQPTTSATSTPQTTSSRRGPSETTTPRTSAPQDSASQGSAPPAVSRVALAAPAGPAGTTGLLVVALLAVAALVALAAALARPRREAGPGPSGVTRTGRAAAPEPPPPPAATRPRGLADDATAELVARAMEVRDLVPHRALASRLDTGLAAVGFEPFDPVGEHFDDRRHHAVGVRDSDDAALAGTVAATERVGYERHGVLHRPADVIVYRAEGVERR